MYWQSARHTVFTRKFFVEERFRMHRGHRFCQRGRRCMLIQKLYTCLIKSRHTRVFTQKKIAFVKKFFKGYISLFSLKRWIENRIDFAIETTRSFAKNYLLERFAAAELHECSELCQCTAILLTGRHIHPLKWRYFFWVIRREYPYKKRRGESENNRRHRNFQSPLIKVSREA